MTNDPETKRCYLCETVKPLSDFHRDRTRRDGLALQCRACSKTYSESYRERTKAAAKRRSKEYYEKHKERIKRRSKRWHHTHKKAAAERARRYRTENWEQVETKKREWRNFIKSAFFDMYGGHCTLCDPSNTDSWNREFLTLDHVNGGGNIERRARKNNTMWAYQDAISLGFPNPDKYRILCFNHNRSLGNPRKPMAELSYSSRVVRRLKDGVIAGYGGRCACCGESTQEFLELDHVNGGGLKQRKERGGHCAAYRDAKNRGFPEDYQVLCGNCNMSKHLHGTCVHRRTNDSSGIFRPMEENHSTAVGQASIG